MVKGLLRLRDDIHKVTSGRLDEFRGVRERWDDMEMFKELAFCLFTPQSKAQVCWDAVEMLERKGLLLNGDERDIAKEIAGVRFRNTKARRLVSVRTRFFREGRFALKEELLRFDDPFKMRRWLVDSVNGLGFKEASHFLRNIGFGEDMAILDRHILRNLTELGVIDTAPSSLSGKRYLEIEGVMRRFSKEIGIPMDELDLILWYKETGGVFK